MFLDKNWLSKKTKPQEKQAGKIIGIADIFSGCGGMSLGAIEASMLHNLRPKIKLAVETNTYASTVYKNNFSDKIKALLNSKIETIIDSDPGEPISKKEKLLKAKIGKIHILLAGPPCQGHSRLNNYTRSNDPRNSLYLKAVRMAEIFKPGLVVIENVVNIIKDKDRVINQSSLALEKIGYEVENLTVHLSNYGVAQNRKRHIQIATLKRFKIDFSNYKVKYVLSDVISDILDESVLKEGLFFSPSKTKHQNRIDFLFEKNLYDLPNRLRPDCHKDKHTYPSCYGRLNWNKPSSTITRGFSTMGQGRFLHPLRRRTLTPHEACRIQGIPDYFDFSSVEKRGELHLMIANAVPPRIIACIIDQYIKNIFNK